MDKKAFYKISSGVYILGSKQSGCIINTFIQVASDPKTVVISVNKDNYTHGIISKEKCFNVTPVTENIDMNIIRKFGFSSSKDINKYEGLDINKDSHESYYVTKNTASVFECEVINEIDLNTHTLFIAKVIYSKVLSDENVMTYEYYQTVKKGLTPPKAPSYKEESKGYVCPICGYVHDEKPEKGFICPICGAPGTIFKNE